MADGPLWTPDPRSLPACRFPPSRRKPAGARGRRFDGYDALHAWSVERSRRLLGSRSGISAASSARRASAASSQGAAMRETRFFPDARLNFAENLLRRARRRDGDRLPRRGQGRAAAELGRAARARLAPAAGDARRRASAPATASPRCCRTCRRRSRSCSPPPRSARSCPPARRISASAACSTASARSSRSCSSPATAIGTTARRSTSRRRSQAIAAKLPSAGETSIVPYLGRAEEVGGAGLPRGATLDAFVGGLPAGAARLRAAALRSSALHPLLLRHDRRAEMHRARRRRHAAAAPEGAPAALLAAGRRKALLLHHLGWMMWNWLVSGLASGRDAPPL